MNDYFSDIQPAFADCSCCVFSKFYQGRENSAWLGYCQLKPIPAADRFGCPLWPQVRKGDFCPQFVGRKDKPFFKGAR